MRLCRAALAAIFLIALALVPSDAKFFIVRGTQGPTTPVTTLPPFAVGASNSSGCSGNPVTSCTITGINLSSTTAKLFIVNNGCGDVNCSPTATPAISTITGTQVSGCVLKRRHAGTVAAEVQQCNITAVNSNASVTVNYAGSEYYANVGYAVIEGLIADENIANDAAPSSNPISVSTSGPTTQANDFVLAFMSNGSPSALTVGSGYTAIYNNPSAPGGWAVALEYSISNSVGVQTATATAANGGGGTGIILAFRATAPPPSTISGISPNSVSFTTPASGSTPLATFTATCSAGPCVGATFAKGTGAGCTSTDNGSFNVASNGVLTPIGTVNAGTYHIGVVVTISGATNSGSCYTAALTGSNVTGVACDQGGTFPGNVPAPAAQPGVAFNTCALYAKFSQSQYSNNANWISDCGASGVYTSWHIQGALFGESVPCSRLNQTTDSGQTVMHVQYLTTDNSLVQNGLFELHWPNGAGNGNALPFEMFSNIKFRVDSASLNTNWSPAGGPVDWWMTNDRSNATYPGWIEIDYLESFNAPPVSNWGGGTIEWNNGCSGGACQFGAVTAYSVDLSSYHSLSVLVTSDESTQLSKCTWVDGNPVGCNTLGNFTFPATWNNPNLYELAFWWGAGHSPVPTLNTNIDAYIEEIEVFVCSAYKTGRCTSSVILSQSSFTPP